MRKFSRYRSSILFPTPSFLMGAGSVLNIAGNYFSFRRSVGNKQADLEAIRSDWSVVGKDLKQVADSMLQSPTSTPKK